jgi:murein DD-endopeptidase MepM/ murein hydrolase activator NlpD
MSPTLGSSRADATPPPARRRSFGRPLAVLFLLVASIVGVVGNAPPASASPANVMFWPVTAYVYPGRQVNPGVHNGIDLTTSAGTPVHAPQGGTIVDRGYGPPGNDGRGHFITIDHGGGWTSNMFHFQSAAPVQVGQTVTRGDIVGYVGSTGNSSGPHLHWEIRFNGGVVDFDGSNFAQDHINDGMNVFANQPVPGNGSLFAPFGGLPNWIPFSQAISPGPNPIGLGATRVTDISGARRIQGVLVSPGTGGCLRLTRWASGTPTLVAQQNTTAPYGAFSLGDYAGGYFAGTLDWSPTPCAWSVWTAAGGFLGGHRFGIAAGIQPDAWYW